MTEVRVRYRKAKEMDAQDDIEYLDRNPDLIIKVSQGANRTAGSSPGGLTRGCRAGVMA